MNHPPSEQSSNDQKIEAECSLPQINHPTNDIQTSFEELHVQHPDHFRK
jgi:hypothetical protein